jgi:hypothetical protein
MRESTRSLKKSTKNMEASPSKIKLSVKEIPEEDNHHTKKAKKSKKDEKKLEEFMKIYGL